MSDILGGSTTRSGKNYQNSQEEDLSAHSPPRPTQGLLAAPMLGPQEDKPEEPMETHLKLPTLKGAVDEDMDRFWFMTNLVWMAQWVVSDTVKRAQLSLAFEERALDWYMWYIPQNRSAMLQNIKDALKK